MNRTNELLCTHSALLFAVLMGASVFVIAGWLPPTLPSLNAEQITALFEQDRLRIRLGMTVLAFASIFWWSFSAAIAMQMKRIEGDSHPLTYVQMASATGTVMVLLLSAYFWLAATYRAETPPGTVQIFNDIAWLMFVGAYPPAFIQNLSIALCILTDKSEVKAYPRWIGFANIWIAILFVPGALLVFFKTGPFAWNGIISFWMVAFVFFGWIVMMWWGTVRAIKQQA